MRKILALMLVTFLFCGQAVAASADEGIARDRAVADFSCKLLAQAAQSGEQNVVISPVSAYLALSMAAAGAGGDTAEQFGAVLGVDADALPAYCAELSKVLEDGKGSTILAIANSGWLDESFTADPAYLKRISGDMNAEVFVRELAADGTREEINGWVSDETRALIPSLLGDNLPEDTAFALINTLYFKGAWSDPFDAYDTGDDVFRLADGSKVSVPFLCAPEHDQGYIKAEGVEGVLLPYDDGETALLALRATDGRSAGELAQSLTPESLNQYVESAEETFMTLSMPKFTLSYGMTMNDALEAMGLSLAFDRDGADFSGMGVSSDGNIYISEVLQKVRITVNEEGTEAAAATAVVGLTAAAMPTQQPLVLKLDSPFVYAMVDLQTGIPLFVGCLDDPSLSEEE